MDVGLVLRILEFQARGDGSVIDAALRADVLPRLAALPGLRDLYAGRRVWRDLEDRVIVSVWERGATLDEREPVVSPAEIEAAIPYGLAESRVERLAVRAAIRLGLGESPRVLRIFRGETRPEELEAYIAEAFSWALAGRATRPGIAALYLGVEPPSRFTNVSVWLDWDAIEGATGGDIGRPLVAPRPERL
ncbi:MAG TPA: hypothetical protein VNJ28_09130, partial [Candidatus Limnocylindrales bacterium]|nr:hypothetical protein [Candidatus Limnocylindrales bacterium]